MYQSPLRPRTWVPGQPNLSRKIAHAMGIQVPGVRYQGHRQGPGQGAGNQGGYLIRFSKIMLGNPGSLNKIPHTTSDDLGSEVKLKAMKNDDRWCGSWDRAPDPWASGA